MFGKTKKKWELRGKEAAFPTVKYAAELTKTVCRGVEPNNDTFLDVLILNTALYVIFLDRQAFNMLAEDDRNDFTDGLIPESALHICKALSLSQQDFKPVITQINHMIEKLAPFSQELMSEKGKSPKGTLYWEYSKLLDDDYGLGARVSLIASLASAQLGIELWKETKELFEA